MIEQALVFALGALSAGLIALVLFPAFTKRAARLARRDLVARLPRSPAEIAAAKDAVRAECAAKTARVEAELRAVRKTLIDERLARAGEQNAIGALRREIATYREGLKDADQRGDGLRLELAGREEALRRETAERREVEHRLNVEAERRRDAEDRADEAERLATEIRLALIASEARAVSAADALEAFEAEREALELRLAAAEEALRRHVGEVAALAAEGSDAGPLLAARIDELLLEQTRLADENAALRHERDRLRLVAMGLSGLGEGADREPVGRVIETTAAVVAARPSTDPRATRPRPVGDDAPEVRPPTAEDAAEFGIRHRPQDAVPAQNGTTAIASAAREAGASPFDPASADLDAERVEDLAKRLKRLRARNASARARQEAETRREPPGEAAPAPKETVGEPE